MWEEGRYEVSELLEMKAEHEAIVRAALSAYPPSRAHAVTFSARVGSVEIGIDPNEARAAMVAAGIVPYERDPIDLSIHGLNVPDDAAHYWPMQTEELRKKVAERLHGRIDRGEVSGIALFAFAPMPLLIELGSLLPDHWKVSVFQLHREPRGWSWANDREPMAFSVDAGTALTSKIALKIEVSDTIGDSRIMDVMPAGTGVWSLRAKITGNDVIRRPDDLSNFRAAFRRAMREIGEAHPQAKEINVFPAMPLSCAVEVGRARQPKADLPMVVWDKVAGRGFEERLRIGG
ncbi:MAG: SAVED domain-containing protein [Pseudomonadota bacterium]